MLSLTNSVHLGRFPPLNALAPQEKENNFATNGGGGVRDETFVLEDNGVWDAITDEAKSLWYTFIITDGYGD